MELKPKVESKIFFRHFDPRNYVVRKAGENQKVTTRHIIESDTLNIIKSELELRVKLITEETCWLKNLKLKFEFKLESAQNSSFIFQIKQPRPRKVTTLRNLVKEI